MTSSRWQRIILLTILAYETFGGLTGGAFLVAAPDGHLMDLPRDLTHGTFPDYFIPGVILLGMGLINLIAFIAVLTRDRFDWMLASIAMYGFVIWFAVEIAVIREVHWLHIMWGGPVIVGGLIVLPKIPWPLNKKTK